LPNGPWIPIQQASGMFSIYKLIRWHTYRCFIRCSICPQCIMKHVLQFLPHLIHGLLQNVLDLLIWCFSLTTCLGMVGSCNVVLDSIFCQELTESLVNEMWSSITNDQSWCSKSWKYHFMEHLLGMPGVSISTW
jgi:hypothetical protein